MKPRNKLAVVLLPAVKWNPFKDLQLFFFCHFGNKDDAWLATGSTMSKESNQGV